MALSVKEMIKSEVAGLEALDELLVEGLGKYLAV